MEKQDSLLLQLIRSDRQPLYKIAGQTGIHPERLSGYAKGRYRLTPRALHALSEYFSVAQPVLREDNQNANRRFVVQQHSSDQLPRSG